MATIAIKSFLVGIPIGIAVFDYIGYVARVDGNVYLTHYR